MKMKYNRQIFILQIILICTVKHVRLFASNLQDIESTTTEGITIEAEDENYGKYVYIVHIFMILLLASLMTIKSFFSINSI